MKIPFIDLKKRYIQEQDQINKILNKVLKSGNLIGSNDVKTFEENISIFLKKKYCVSLNSGTDALMMAMHALKIGKGDEVITTPISFIATLGAIVHVGAKPILVDVDDDLNIDVNLIEQRITKKTKAIIPVHWTGRMCKMDKIRSIARKHGLYIIEDAAQAIGSTYKNHKPGYFSDIATFSAHPLKVLNAIGDGGFLVTDKKHVYDFIQKYKNHGLAGRDQVEIFGVNSRLDSINSAILNFRLKKLNNVISKRKKIIDIYRKNINSKFFKIIDDKKNNINSNTMFVSLAENRDELQKFLKKNNIESLIYYGKAMHQHKAFIDKFGKQRFIKAENFVNKVISLPFNQYLDRDQILFVCKMVNKFYA